MDKAFINCLEKIKQQQKGDILENGKRHISKWLENSAKIFMQRGKKQNSSINFEI